MDTPAIRVMALHALVYCERLFYLEEVEEIRLADASVYAGRRLHEEIAADEGQIVSLVLETEALGLRGKIDCLRRREPINCCYWLKAWIDGTIVCHCATQSSGLQMVAKKGAYL